MQAAAQAAAFGTCLSLDAMIELETYVDAEVTVENVPESPSKNARAVSPEQRAQRPGSKGRGLGSLLHSAQRFVGGGTRRRASS